MKMRSSLNRQCLIVLSMGFGLFCFIPATLAQDTDAHADHAQHVIPEPVADEDAESPQVMDHENMNMNMNMETEQAATASRSPHEYSNGYERERGPYALPVSEQVSLADEQSFSRLLFNRFERLENQSHVASRFDVQVWYGETFDHFVLKTEGELHGSSLEESKSELLWSYAATRFWDAQFGVRIDNGNGPSRSWLAAGVQGLAPYWFDVHATAFVGEKGRTAFSFEAEYEARLSQKLTLKPRIDFNIYGKADREKSIGSGLSNSVLGLRLQYQINRQFAPYLGVEQEAKFGETADFARIGFGLNARETRWVAGFRFWR